MRGDDRIYMSPPWEIPASRGRPEERHSRTSKRVAALLPFTTIILNGPDTPFTTILNGPDTVPLTPFISSRDIERKRDIHAATPGRGRGRSVSPTRITTSPEKEELDLTGWDSLEMTSVLRWPCPYEVIFPVGEKNKSRAQHQAPKMLHGWGNEAKAAEAKGCVLDLAHRYSNVLFSRICCRCVFP